MTREEIENKIDTIINSMWQEYGYHKCQPDEVLIKYPRFDATIVREIIRSIEKARRDWYIKNDKKDYADDKVYFICRWLNHSFRKFTKRQQENYNKIKENYIKSKQQ